jgi:hypothetical protein
MKGRKIREIEGSSKGMYNLRIADILKLYAIDCGGIKGG